jgi:hypothetical protein
LLFYELIVGWLFYLRFGESYLSVVRHTASTNMSNSDYYFFVTIRRILFICGSTCRRAEHVEQQLLFFSYDSENLIYLWFDIPQSRTCRTAIIIFYLRFGESYLSVVRHAAEPNMSNSDYFLVTIRRILFICGSTCRRAEHVEQRGWLFYLRFGESYLSVVRHAAESNMSNSNYYFLVTIRRILFICGSTCRRAEHVEQLEGKAFEE